MPVGISTTKIFELVKGQGTGDRLREVCVPFAFFILLRWAEEQQREEEAIALFEGKEYTPPIPEMFSWSQISVYIRHARTEHLPNFIRQLVSFFKHLGNEGIIQGLPQAAQVFDDEKLVSNPHLLFEICSIIDNFSFETSEDRTEVGSFFEDLIEKSIRATRFAGEMFSPQNITELMLEIADPKPGEKVYDPCFGTASFLSGAGRRMLAAADSPTAWENVRTNGIYGIEINPTAYLIGLTRTVLAGISQPNLVLGNSLERGITDISQKFDVILAAPPIGSHSSNRRLFNQFSIKAHSLENFFVQHIAAHLAPNGRAIVAMPEGFLFRGGGDEKLRKLLLTEYEVEGVISLPEGSFAPYTMVKPNLIIFRRNKPKSYLWFQEVEAASQKIQKDKSVIFDPQEEAQIFRRVQTSNSNDAPKQLKNRLNHWSSQPEFEDWTAKPKSEFDNRERIWKVQIASLAEKEFDLSVKRFEINKVALYLERLREKFPQLEVVKLKDKNVAEVISGVGYTRQNTDDNPADTSVPLIRVTELSKNGEIKTPSRFVSEQLLRQSAHKRLKTGDIIVSTQGTIGKTGRVSENIDGAVPAHGITTIRLLNNRIHPVYLMNLLQSPAYQSWFKSEAVGAVIMNLSVKRLEELPIPLINSELQQRIAAVYLEEGKPVDILEYVANLEDVLEIEVLFLGDSLLDKLTETGFDEIDVEFEARELAEKLHEWVTNVKIKNDLFIQPLNQLKNIARKLADSFMLPLDIVRFGFLQVILQDIKKFKLNEIVQKSSTEEKQKVTGWSVPASLLQLAEAMEKVSAKQSNKLLYQGQIDITVEPTNVVLNKEADFTVKVTNNQLLPIRDFVLEVENSETSDGSWDLVPMLPPGKTENFSCYEIPTKEGVDSFNLKWKAVQFDETVVEGSLEHRFRVLGQQTLFDDSDIGTNPYITGKPLLSEKNQEMFFGRQDVIDRVRRTLKTEGESNIILMEGNRRAGKTSILRRLQVSNVLPQWVPVYLSIQQVTGNKKGSEGIYAEEIFYLLTKEIILALHKSGYEFDAIGIGKISPKISGSELRDLLYEKTRSMFENGNSFELLDSQIEKIQNVIGEKRILLMLDEFNTLYEKIEKGLISSVVPENIRALLHKHSHISAILSGAKRIRQLRADYFGALYGLGIPIEINALDINSAQGLITEPVEGRLLYKTETRDKIIELTKCQPFLIQLLCSRIFDECAEIKEKFVNSRVVEIATQKMTADNEHFKTLFDFIPSSRASFIACLVNELSKSPDKITIDLINEKLLESGVQHTTKELDEDVRGLRELDILELENNSYRIKLPLFGEWLSKNEDINAVRRRAAEE